jgi:hypothetical protein
MDIPIERHDPPDARPGADAALSSREALLHEVYEAAELEHNLLCTYLYAAFSLKTGEEEGLSAQEAAAVARWRRTIVSVAIDEMGHLAAVWNITAALGGTPRFGRANFPLDPGYLPAQVVVRLAPFNADVLQHFIHLERPGDSDEPDGEGYAPERLFERGTPVRRLVPMGLDYETVGEFYAALGDGLRALVAARGEAATFCGDPMLQVSAAEIDLPGARRVVCLRSALEAFDAIVAQGEGAQHQGEDSHFERFCAIRAELQALQRANPAFVPAHPAATNPVLRRPPKPEGRVWLENEAAIATVDLANAGYALMLRLFGLAWSVPAPHPDKALAANLAIGLMRAIANLGERAARLPAGPSHPRCHAGMSFTNLRDAAPLPAGASGRRLLAERLRELAEAAARLAAQDDDARLQRSAGALRDMLGQVTDWERGEAAA